MPRSLTVALVQVSPRQSKSETLKSIAGLMDSYEGSPDIVAFPEYLMLDPTGLDPREVYGVAESINGEWVSYFREMASSLSSCVVTHMFEKSGTGKVYNTVVVIDGKGEVVATYKKTHLFDALGYKESSFTVPGPRLFQPIDVCGVRLGIAVCFELRYPEVFRYQALMGAEIVVVPTAWYRGPAKDETLMVYARARAGENTVFLAVPSNPGPNFVGRSMIVDPMGIVRVDAGIGEKIVEYRIDLGELSDARSRMPLLKMLRRDLYRVAGDH